MVPISSHMPKIHSAIKVLSKKKKEKESMTKKQHKTNPTTEQLDWKEPHALPWGSANSVPIGFDKGDHKAK